MQSQAVVRKNLDTAGERRRQVDGGTRRNAEDTAARASVLTVYSVPGTVSNTCTHCLAASARNPTDGVLPRHAIPVTSLSPPHRAPTTSCQVHPSPLLTQPQPQGLLCWLLKTAWGGGAGGSTLAHLRAFARPFLCLEPLFQVHGWLAVTLEVQWMCYLHREAFFDLLLPTFK